MNEVLEKYVPEQAVRPSFELIRNYSVNLKVVKRRFTRHGDYRRLPDGRHQITVNATSNKYRFLVTLIHEIAHLVAFEKYGRQIKPHGKEWKQTFKYLMVPFLRPDVFPMRLLPVLANHFKNPKASSGTDANLSIALKEYDAEIDATYIFEIPAGAIFRIYNGKRFKKGSKRVKRYECVEVATGKLYLFQPNAEVELIND